MQQLGHDDNDQYQGHAAGHLSLWAGVGEVEVRLVALFMFVTKKDDAGDHQKHHHYNYHHHDHAAGHVSPWAGVGEVDGWPTVRSSDHRTLLAGHRGGDDDLDEEDGGTPFADRKLRW